MKRSVLALLATVAVFCSTMAHGRPHIPAVQAVDAATESQGQDNGALTPGDTKINPVDGAEMVYVPAGDFQMGLSDAQAQALPNSSVAADWVSSAKPQHRVYLDGYWIDKNLITVPMYRHFCDVTGRKMPDMPAYAWHIDTPITMITWDDADAYCKWAHASLPTEAQWEKAARGTDGRLFPWGNQWDGRCRSNAGNPAPVGSYPSGASPYGALDMAGNVWEWCADWYDPSYYRTSPDRNPEGPATGKCRVLRGGAWDYHDPVAFCSACRYDLLPSHGYDVAGFRCVVNAN